MSKATLEADVQTRSELFRFLKKKVESSSPQVMMPGGFYYTFQDICSYFEKGGRFQLASDFFAEYLFYVFNHFADTASQPQLGSPAIIRFIGLVYEHALHHEAAHRGGVSFPKGLGCLMEALQWQPSLLLEHKEGGRRFIRSTPAFAEMSGRTVSVPLKGRMRWQPDKSLTRTS